MTENKFEQAYESIPMDPAMSDRLLRRLMAEAPETSPDKEVIMKRTKTVKIWRTLLIAAVIALMLGATAYAAGILGPRALIVDEPRQTPGKLVLSENGETAEVARICPTTSTTRSGRRWRTTVPPGAPGRRRAQPCGWSTPRL